MQAQARRFSRAGVMLIGLALMLLSVVPAAKADAYNPDDWAPMVWSDKADYAPGEQVTLTGAHWQRGETVHIRVNDDTGSQLGSRHRRDRGRDWRDHRPVQPAPLVRRPVPRDGHGGLGCCCHAHLHRRKSAVGSDRAWEPDRRPGVERGLHRLVPIAGNDGTCTLDLSASGLPAGATATFGNTSLTGTKGKSPSTSLTVATTGATPPGTTTFTVTAARQSNCQGNGDLTGTANLVVAKSVAGHGRRTGGHADGRYGRKRHPFGHREPERRDGNGVHRQPERERPACGRHRIVQPEQRQLRERRHLEDLHPDDHDDVGGSRRLDPLHRPRDEPERHR